MGPSLVPRRMIGLVWFAACLHVNTAWASAIQPVPLAFTRTNDPDRRYNLVVTVHEKFVEDMNRAGIATEVYRSRFFWEGPAARSDEQNGPTLWDIIKKTAVPLQWDRLNSNYIVYPSGEAAAGWKDNVADSENDEGPEPDAYNDAYAAKTRKGDDDEED